MNDELIRENEEKKKKLKRDKVVREKKEKV